MNDVARRIGIRGFKVTADGILYAPTAEDGLMKLAKHLIEVAQTPLEQRGNIEPMFVRGHIQIEEME